jgi:hypothetical protein
MSDETASSPENSVVPATESVPRAKKAATPRPRKVAKKAVATDGNSAVAVIEAVGIPAATALAPVMEHEEPTEVSTHTDGEWPEPDAASTGGSGSPSESTKRKRRRRKGKGQNSAQQNLVGPVSEEVISQTVSESKAIEISPDQRASRPNQQPHPQSHSQQQPSQRPKVDPELLTKMAWKIYLAEVSEEGVALIGDSDAKDLSRRCFRLAEIFVEEQMRRR